MSGPHCPQCADYEHQVMAKAAGTELPPEVQPCRLYVMSDRFRDWMVESMRREVLGQVSLAGLDRMAILKDPPKGRST